MLKCMIGLKVLHYQSLVLRHLSKMSFTTLQLAAMPDCLFLVDLFLMCKKPVSLNPAFNPPPAQLGFKNMHVPSWMLMKPTFET